MRYERNRAGPTAAARAGGARGGDQGPPHAPPLPAVPHGEPPGRAADGGVRRQRARPLGPPVRRGRRRVGGRGDRHGLRRGVPLAGGGALPRDARRHRARGRAGVRRARERAVVSVAKILADRWSHGYRPVLHAIDFTRPLEELRRAVEPRYRQVVLKRLMYRAAEAVARELRATAIVTGESVGQVSSQTLDNLRAIGEATALPVLRPLIGFDKIEIIARARTIGTAAVSAHVREYCAIEQARPVTHASPQAVADEESRVDLAVLDEAVAARKRLDLRALTATDLIQPYLFAADIPDGAVVLDCREPQHYEAWCWPGAERWDPVDLAERFPALDKTRRYILYCTLGLHSGYLAEAMQRAGYEAYSFKGGVRGLQAYAQTRGIPVATIRAG